jgi:hypothetical protein
MAYTDLNLTIQINNLLPIRKRLTNYFATLLSLTSPIQLLHDVWQTIYLNGIVTSVWSSASTYAVNDKVVGLDNAVYQSLVSSNTNNDPTTTSGFWTKIEDNYIGVYERIKYNAQILTFEYALNKWFSQYGAVFQQPPLVPDIYITTNVVVPNVFVVGGLETNSSQSYFYDFANFNYVIDSYTFAQYDFSIWIPLIVYDALLPSEPSGLTTNKSNIVRQFADKYNLAGINYDIQLY